MTDKKVWFITGAGRGMGGGHSLRWVAGADAVEQKARDLLAQIDAYRDLSSPLAIGERQPAGSAR